MPPPFLTQLYFGRSGFDLQTEDKQRKKAAKAATKQNKPLFEEDGERRGLLDKYDEEEKEAGMQIDALGAVSEAKLKRQEEVRARLRAGAFSAILPQ